MSTLGVRKEQIAATIAPIPLDFCYAFPLMESFVELNDTLLLDDNSNKGRRVL